MTIVDRAKDDGTRVEEGALACVACSRHFPIVRFVPRFVPEENYASGFGLEWVIHARTQYDSYSGHPLSAQRFFEETQWEKNLNGEVVIEPGSGSGRFTEQAASTGATVLSLDYSYAVDANYASNGHHANVLIVQGDIFEMPFPSDYADKLFCFGVLQHTPDPRRALHSVVRHVKPGGRLVFDMYLKSFARYVLGTKYWVRPLTRRVPPERLYRWVRRYVDVMWPLARIIRQIPGVGRALNWRLLVADYSYQLRDDRMLKEWARLDTFDMLSPRYDYPQTLQTVERWCEEAGLIDADVSYGYNGIQVRAVRP